MKTKIKEVSPVVVQVEVSIPWKQVESSYSKAISEIAGMATVPGFRKGRAPAALIKKKFREDITNSVAREKIPGLVEKVIEKEKLKAVGEPQIAQFSLKEKDKFSFEFYHEVKPTFELKEWRGIEVESLNTNVTDEMVENRINSVLKAHAKKEEIKDSSPQENDLVKFQLTIMDNDNKEIIFDENFTETLNDSFPYPSLKESILSSKAGEDIDMDMVPEESFEIPDARGKNVKVFIEMQSVNRETVPELDEEFAKHEGEDTVEAFKKKTRESLENETKENEKNRVGAVLMENILKEYDFELPSTLVYGTLEFMAKNELGPYINYIQNQQQRQQLIDNFFQSRAAGAEQMVRFELILEKIGETEGLEIADDEVKAKIEEVLPYIPEESREKIDPNDMKSGLADRVRQDLLHEKAKNMIYDDAKITWVDELTPAPEPEPEPAAEEKSATDSETKSTKTQSEQEEA